MPPVIPYWDTTGPAVNPMIGITNIVGLATLAHLSCATALQDKTPRRELRGFSIPRQQGNQPMSLSSARNYALRASKSQDQKEAIELLSEAILELAMSIEASDAKIKKINKSS